MPRVLFNRLRTVLSHAFAFFVLVSGGLFVPALAAPQSLSMSLASPGPPIQGQPIRLILTILPPPSTEHPLHLHVYVDGRMILMTTAKGPNAAVTLPPLAKGRHEVEIAEADIRTHRGMGQMSTMEGRDNMDMGGMGMGGSHAAKMPESPTPKHFLTRMTLLVKGRTAP